MNTHSDILRTISDEFCLNKIRNLFLEKGEIPENLEVLWNSFLMRDSDTNQENLKPVIIDGVLFLKTQTEFYTKDLQNVKQI